MQTLEQHIRSMLVFVATLMIGRAQQQDNSRFTFGARTYLCRPLPPTAEGCTLGEFLYQRCVGCGVDVDLEICVKIHFAGQNVWYRWNTIIARACEHEQLNMELPADPTSALPERTLHTIELRICGVGDRLA